ncbi:MAG: hypothetical protein NVS9B15_02650 [Acidobacteriaceae bacterium]
MQTKLILSVTFLLAASAAFSQSDQVPTANAQTQQSGDQVPTFRVNVVGRTAQAVNWHHASGWTKVDLQGTDLMPQAKGSARVRAVTGRTEVQTDVSHLGDPQQFGREYLTFVAWAVTPEGRAQNLGEIVHDDHGNTHNQTFTTDLQAFGLIITAEPHFAVTQPSNIVCLENVIRKDTVGATEPINVHYELIERGGYITAPAAYQPVLIDKKLPFDIYEAMNAVRIAADNGAQQYAPEAYNRAADLLQQAQDYAMRKKVEARPIATVAREAAQQAQDALTLTLRRKAEERQTTEGAAAAERQRAAEQQTEEARRRAEQDAAAREAAEQQARLAAQQQQQAELQSQQSQQQAAQAAQAQQEAEAARQRALQEQQAAEAAAQQAQQAAQQAQAEREQLRARLLQQFNTILVTRDSARGLIANLSDVLFATNSYQLKPQAKLALAKFSGIVQAYPGLHLQVEGNTDSTGSPQYNQRLSDRRANSVRDFLTSQGVPADSITAQGLGQTNPVASNDTAKGRAQNRRVEIVVSGDVIGQPIGQVRSGATSSVPPPPQTPPGGTSTTDTPRCWVLTTPRRRALSAATSFLHSNQHLIWRAFQAAHVELEARAKRPIECAHRSRCGIAGLRRLGVLLDVEQSAPAVAAMAAEP